MARARLTSFNNEGEGGGGWYFINTKSSGVYSGYSAFISSSGVYNSSSRRWKTNIQTLPDALAKIEQLRGVSYDRKDSGKHEIGVIAEEVGAVVPEVVSYEKNGKDAAGVDYGRLTALLIEATKEQQALIHEQQKQIRLQQSRLNAQESQSKLQQAEIASLTREVRAVQAALKASSRANSGVRKVKAQAPVLHQ